MDRVLINLGTRGFSRLRWEFFGVGQRPTHLRPQAEAAGHYEDLTETRNRARKVSGTQGMFCLVLLTSPESVNICCRRQAEKPEQQTGNRRFIFFFSPLLALRARFELRAKCRVCLAWLMYKAPVIQAKPSMSHYTRLVVAIKMRLIDNSFRWYFINLRGSST